MSLYMSAGVYRTCPDVRAPASPTSLSRVAAAGIGSPAAEPPSRMVLPSGRLTCWEGDAATAWSPEIGP